MKLLQKLRRIKKAANSSWLSLSVFGAIIVALSLGQLTRITLQDVAIYWHDVGILVFLLMHTSTLKKVVTEKKKQVKEHSLQLLFLGVLLLGMILAYAITKDVTPWLYLLRILAYLVFLLVSRRIFSKNPQILLYSSIFIGISMMLFGIAQYSFLPDTRYLFSYGWDEHYYRLLGSLLDPNYTGLVLIITGWGLVQLRKKISPPMFYLTLLVLIASCVLTFSRASYLALFISAVAYVGLSFKKVKTADIILPAGVALLLITGVILSPKPGGEGVDLLRTSSITARYSTSTAIISQMKPWQLIIGSGFYTLPSLHTASSHARTPDNLFLMVFYSTGVLGLAVALAICSAHLQKVKSLEPEVLAILAAAFIHAQFNNSLLEPFIFLILGLSLAARKKKIFNLFS